MSHRLLQCLVGLLAVTLAGCVSLPRDGTVRSGPVQEQGEQSQAPFDYTPDRPRPGAAPLDIVGGYLLAMQATPVRTAVAREFLTDQAGTDWVPDRSTVVYDGSSLQRSGRTVRMELSGTAQLDARGEWLGDPTGGRGIRHALRLVRERGEWRIDNPPDALMVPRSHFETRFAQYFLYFFDKSAQVLVPEPVYLPQDEQAPTLLVRGLLAGPDPVLLGATRTFVPEDTELDDLSVLVSRDGTAEVALSEEILDLDKGELDRMLAQLSWTLRQVPGVESMRITVDGSPLDVSGADTDQDVQEGWPEFDPSVNWASEELFGIRDRRVVTLVGDDERRVSGPFGTADHELRSIGVALAGDQIAGVHKDGTRALVTPWTGQAESPDGTDVAYSGGTDLLPPVWDIHDQVWLVDRRDGGAALSVVRSGTATELTAPGITGERVKSFLLSRDGTRLVAAIAGERRDRLVVARIMRGGDGAVRRLSPAMRLSVGALDVTEIRDLAWRTPGTVALLTGPNLGLSQVVVALIDGSSALGDVTADADVFHDKAVRIVTSPAPDAPVYVGTTDRRLYELAANGRWTGTGIERGLLSPTFVG